MVRILATALLLVFFRCDLAAQDAVQIDSGTVVKPAVVDTAGFVMAKSPLGAVLRSAIIPGWGQWYNESYWKIPVIIGVSAWLISGIVSENSSFIKYRDLYAASITTAVPAGDLRYKQYREFYRDNRDTYAWYLGLFYLIQIADAFVDAHLFDFNVSSPLQTRLGVLPTGRVAFQIRF
jgi:hypothetical protein